MFSGRPVVGAAEEPRDEMRGDSDEEKKVDEDSKAIVDAEVSAVEAAPEAAADEEVEETHRCRCCATSWAAARTLPVVAPVLFVAAVVGIHQTRHYLHRLLRQFEHQLHVDSHVVDDIEGYLNMWISYTSVLDTTLLVATILSAGLVRDWLRLCLSTSSTGRAIIHLESAMLGALFLVAYVGMYIAIAFAIVCAIVALVSFAVYETCKATGTTARSATAFIASQIDQYTSVKVRFCNTDLDDTLQQFEQQADDDTAFSDDDGCFNNVSSFCEVTMRLPSIAPIPLAAIRPRHLSRLRPPRHRRFHCRSCPDQLRTPLPRTVSNRRASHRPASLAAPARRRYPRDDVFASRRAPPRRRHCPRISLTPTLNLDNDVRRT